ncbi:MAG TPA: crotonase/enoyl-CoA hydratase family protein [Chitinophagales bacterium]|nr:crotonase/enoyl-CoA hydratase family protein [Chitinophagales bacterium]
MEDSVLYEKDGRIARIRLNRPEHLNAITDGIPQSIAEKVKRANDDDDVHVIILSGAGKAFCSGYDLKQFAEKPRPALGSQDMPWDPMVDFQFMKSCTDHFMSLWRSYKPVICKVQGYAIAGGSDIALCSDIIIMAEDAQIGYPPARVWGCPTTMMWVYRLGAEKAKRMLLTGDLISGKEAEKMGLVYKSVPLEILDDAVERLASRMASIPKNQLMMQKLVINSAYSNMGLETTQMMATLFDGIARHTPEGVAFKKRCEEVGFQKAVKERDSGMML